MIERKVWEIAAIGDLRWRDQLHQRRYRGRGGCVRGVVVEAFEFALDAVRRKLLEVRPCFAPGPTAAGSGGERKLTRYMTLYWLGYGVMGSMAARLLQIDRLVAAVVVKLGTPYLVGALMVAWTEVDWRPQTHVEIAQRF